MQVKFTPPSEKVMDLEFCLLCEKRYRTKKRNLTLKQIALRHSLPFPNKKECHLWYNRALKDGYLTRAKFCERCHKECFCEGHHIDYRFPCIVLWLCLSCHKKVHRKI